MYYEINVALNGRHFFATAERSIRDMNTLDKVIHTFKQKFPASEGYELSVIKYEIIGKPIDFWGGIKP